MTFKSNCFENIHMGSSQKDKSQYKIIIILINQILDIFNLFYNSKFYSFFIVNINTL